jgi:predicted GNAT superfamily acetyltransferase
MNKPLQAIIEMYYDEGGTVCSAYEADAYMTALYNDLDAPDAIFEDAYSLPDEEKEQKKVEKALVLNAFGVLYSKGFRIVRWADEEFSYQGNGKPDWAKKLVYVWENKKSNLKAV